MFFGATLVFSTEYVAPAYIKSYQLIRSSILLRVPVGKLEVGLKSSGAPGPLHSSIFLSFNHLSGSYLLLFSFLVFSLEQSFFQFLFSL